MEPDSNLATNSGIPQLVTEDGVINFVEGLGEIEIDNVAINTTFNRVEDVVIMGQQLC